jgi:6-pyruvoyl-tetrahydropterin synthase
VGCGAEMIELYQEFTIEVSHSLPSQIGTVAMHGHSYWVRIYCESPKDNVVPQPVLHSLCLLLKDKLDHKHLNDLMTEPTMENLAQWIIENWDSEIAITRIQINRPSVGTGIDLWIDASSATFWRAKAEHTQAEIRHMKKSVDHAWEMLTIANQNLKSVGLPPVMTAIGKVKK